MSLVIRIAKRNMIHLTAWIYNFILCFNKGFLPSVTCNTLSPAREWPKYINIITSKRNLSSYEFVWSWQTQSINYTVFKHGIQTKLLDIEWNSPLANLFIGINILCLKVDLWHYIWYKQINHNCLIQIQVATYLSIYAISFNSFLRQKLSICTLTDRLFISNIDFYYSFSILLFDIGIHIWIWLEYIIKFFLFWRQIYILKMIYVLSLNHVFISQT